MHIVNVLQKPVRPATRGVSAEAPVAATIFWRKNAQLEWHKTAISDVTNFYKQRKHALCEEYYDAVFALIENFLTGNWAA